MTTQLRWCYNTTIYHLHEPRKYIKIKIKSLKIHITRTKPKPKKINILSLQ